MKKKKTIFLGNQLPVIVEEAEEGGYIVFCPLFEGCYTQGETIEEALKNIKEVILLCREEMEDQKKKIFIPKVGLHMVEISK
ncbi:MAG: type II toxin-antitoxin system HicB family antitoxin [Candidatus Staskawiczbacteria bacterium]|nr:type II toxin-antitoxin system HicB family antitoxin [Candidatus Staskawiczbacteria bacterium]